MTVKELLNKFKFSEIIAALRHIRKGDRSIESTASYKESFDILRNTEFDGEGGAVTFDVYKNMYGDNSFGLTANGVEGDAWENIVGKDVVVPEGQLFAEVELAAAILWGATFYGFTRHNRWNPCYQAHSRYGRQAELLERKLFVPYIRDRHTIRTLRDLSVEMPFGIGFTSEVWDLIAIRKKHQNRMKRKRFHRIKARINYLKKMDMRRLDIDTIEAGTGAKCPPGLFRRIMDAGTIAGFWFESHAYGSGSRVEYLKNLLTDYSPTFGDCARITEGIEEVIVTAYSAESHPIAEEELRQLERFLQEQCGSAGIRLTLLVGTDNEAKSEIALQALFISKYPTEAEYDDY